MMRISNEQQLVDAFRPIDQEWVRLIPNLEFPLAVRDYQAWTDSSGHRTFVVFQDSETGQARGIVFKRAGGSADPAVSMCEWCHSVRGKSSVGLLSVAVSPNRSIGLHLCRDLSCRENVLSTPGVNDIRESVDAHEKVRRIVDRMSKFARSSLF